MNGADATNNVDVVFVVFESCINFGSCDVEKKAGGKTLFSDAVNKAGKIFGSWQCLVGLDLPEKGDARNNIGRRTMSRMLETMSMLEKVSPMGFSPVASWSWEFAMRGLGKCRWGGAGLAQSS